MEIFLATDEEQREALLQGRFEGAELYAQERIAWDATGVYDDALWVAAHIDDGVATRHEDADGKYMGYRPFTLPRDLVNALAWRAVEAAEVAAARQAEHDAIQAAREQARAEALENGRRLGLIE